MIYDVFNGDADGIIALLQLHLSTPCESVKITGVKRDIELLEQVSAAAGDKVRVFDISMEKNKPALERLLAAGAEVFYVDHHKAGDIPANSTLDAHINLDADTCTSLILSDLLDRRFHLWAITAAYGDNLIARADREAEQLGLSEEQKQALKELGTYINYNGYGSCIDDLHYPPLELFEILLAYTSPFDVIADPGSVFHKLKSAYESDIVLAAQAEVIHEDGASKVIMLDDQAWARRVSGVYGNLLANQSPELAHAIVTYNNSGTYTVSVRAPLTNKQGAVDVCGQFATGGGRAGAAGINELPLESLSKFIQVFSSFYNS